MESPLCVIAAGLVELSPQNGPTVSAILPDIEIEAS